MVREQIRVQAQFLEEGMILARDVEKDGLLLVASGSRLTKKMILQFIQSKISHLWVYEGTQTDNLHIYKKNMESVQNILELAQTGGPIPLNDVEEILKFFIQARSQRSLLTYIYGIRKVDEYTYQHSLNVCYLSMMLSKWIGLKNEASEIAAAGLLHDVGKVKIDHAVLNKPGKLTEVEWTQMKRHSYLGYQLLLENQDIPQIVKGGVLYHHERMDGTGYPQGLKGEQIPVSARIVAIVDVFDAMTSDRVYRDKKDVFEVLQFLYDRHQEFDMKFLHIFTENMLEILVGEDVLLSNNKVGTIIFKNQYKPFSPLVRTDEGFIDLAERTDIKVARVL